MPLPRGTGRCAGRRRPPPPPPGRCEAFDARDAHGMPGQTAAHRCGCICGPGRQADLHMAPHAKQQAGRGRQGWRDRQVSYLFLVH